MLEDRITTVAHVESEKRQDLFLKLFLLPSVFQISFALLTEE